MASKKTTKVVVIGSFPDSKGKPHPVGKEISVPENTAKIGVAAGVFQSPDEFAKTAAPATAGFVSQTEHDKVVAALAAEKTAAAENAAIVEKLKPALEAANVTIDDVVTQLTNSAAQG